VKLSDVNQEDYNAVFYPGGHSALWDLSTDAISVSLIEDFYKKNKPAAFVCHTTAALVNAKTTNGKPLV
jgi:putative intracellular protease/amidase